ncbi:hypothetical protein MKW94_029625 [Papaver nudicaule]|uniref:Uncharacterized protein n=1 Tax=Papaver nudicaule TaxID=74823 RepID=A0AA41SIS7_PAPNU|nr:hypothetical protein [Papaver nudicaule]
METGVYERITSDEYGVGMQLVEGLDDLREKCLFVIEKYFIHPSFEEVLVFGKYKTEYLNLEAKNVFFVYGDVVVPGIRLGEGVYGAKLLPTYPGVVSFYLSVDALIPASQVLKIQSPPKASRSKDDLQLEKRLVSLLFTKEKDREKLTKKLEENAGQSEIILRKYLKDYIFEGYRKTKLLDSQGQGVLHLLASLGYAWAVSLFRQGGLSVDRKDRFGWTALHWAAFYGREGAAKALLHEGVNPSLLTKPTEDLRGLTAADIASNRGYNHLATYLLEMVENPEMIVRISTHLAETAAIKCHGNGGIKD